MPQKTNNKEFALNLNDVNEIYSLGGVDKWLTIYDNLIKSVKAEPSAEADKYRPFAAAQLRAGMKFLFGIAQIQGKAEFASVDWVRLAPIGSRKALAERANALVDKALAALKAFDLQNTMQNVF